MDPYEEEILTRRVWTGVPFILLVGAARNAIAYDSKLFTSAEFFKYGCLTSVILMVVCGLACYIIWPPLGISATIPKPM